MIEPPHDLETGEYWLHADFIMRAHTRQQVVNELMRTMCKNKWEKIVENIPGATCADDFWQRVVFEIALGYVTPLRVEVSITHLYRAIMLEEVASDVIVRWGMVPSTLEKTRKTKRRRWLQPYAERPVPIRRDRRYPSSKTSKSTR